MSTIQEVAKLAGVSVGSVSHYMNGKRVRPETAARIESAIEKLDYKANVLGKNLRSQQSFSIGILINDIDNVFTNSLCTNISSNFQSVGFTTLILDYQGEMLVLKNKIEFLLSRRVDALVIVMSEQRIDNMEWLKDLKIPIVMIDNPILHENFPCIVTDNKQSVYRVVSKMLSHGHERIGLVTPPDDTYVGEQRRLGWTTAYRDRNMVPDSDDLMVCSYDLDCGYQAAKTLLERGKVTGIFAANYYLAVGTLKAIFEKKLTVGKDIGFASFDDLGIVTNITSISVTVVKQPIEKMAFFAVETILNMFSNSHDNWDKGIKIFDSEIEFSSSIKRENNEKN
ncbi:LacI family DNA-binding transcriptional regulator [Enterococcus gilvus]|uniref:LacI family DNA-binding transcriptional regulator n=1 Tax=Enterococcus gilvus TaxID=160453 RepID=UPI003EDA1958